MVYIESDPDNKPVKSNLYTQRLENYNQIFTKNTKSQVTNP